MSGRTTTVFGKNLNYPSAQVLLSSLLSQISCYCVPYIPRQSSESLNSFTIHSYLLHSNTNIPPPTTR